MSTSGEANEGDTHDMPDEIDFAQGVRGQFYRSDVSLHLPLDRDDQAQTPTPPTEALATDNPAFGMWRDREDMADVAAYIRRIRAPRFNRNGSRDKPSRLRWRFVERRAFCDRVSAHASHAVCHQGSDPLNVLIGLQIDRADTIGGGHR